MSQRDEDVRKWSVEQAVSLLRDASKDTSGQDPMMYTDTLVACASKIEAFIVKPSSVDKPAPGFTGL